MSLHVTHDQHFYNNFLSLLHIQAVMFVSEVDLWSHKSRVIRWILAKTIMSQSTGIVDTLEFQK